MTAIEFIGACAIIVRLVRDGVPRDEVYRRYSLLMEPYADIPPYPETDAATEDAVVHAWFRATMAWATGRSGPRRKKDIGQVR